MKTRNYFGLILSVNLLLLAAGSGPVRGAQPTAYPAPVGVSAGSAATAPWFISTVDSVFGSQVSVAIDDSGTTYISYYDAAQKDLKMAKHVGSGGNCGADNDWSCETVASSGDVGKFSSIAIDPTTNLPAIAYWNMVSPYELKLATAWSGGWDIMTVDSGSGGYASLKIDSTGAEHIAYQVNSQGLRYAKHSGAGGNCGGNNYQCDAIDNASGAGRHASLALDLSGQPRIAYFVGGSGGLWYAQPSTSGNCGPGNTWGCYAISPPGDAGQYASLGLDNGNLPNIAYYDATNGKLMYAVWVGIGGNCGLSDSWQCDEIATMGTLPRTRDVSLAVDKAGLPIIAYSWYYGTPYSTRGFGRARPAAALGLQSGNCGPQDLWQCEGIQRGFSTGDYSAIAVHPSGLATIAYSYANTVFDSELRVAYQRFHQVYLPLAMKNQ